MNDFEKKLNDISRRVIDTSYTEIKYEKASKTYRAIYEGRSEDGETWYSCSCCETNFIKSDIHRNKEHKKCCPRCYAVFENLEQET